MGESCKGERMAFVTRVRLFMRVSLVQFGVCFGDIWSANGGLLMNDVCYAQIGCIYINSLFVRHRHVLHKIKFLDHDSVVQFSDL